MPIGERIKGARRALGISRRRLAEKLGVDPLTVRRIENGTRTPTTSELHQAAGALGVSLTSLVTGQEHALPVAKASPEDQDFIVWARQVALNFQAMQRRAQELGVA